MTVRAYRVESLPRSAITDFVESNHYSGNINGVISDYCFGLFDGGTMIGAAIFGRMAMANQTKRFSDNPSEVIELRRLCCIDNTPKNTESYFIGKMLRYLKRHTNIKIVVSYADEEYGHSGVIYKASNFTYMGFKQGGKVIDYNGRLYHDKAIRTKYNGTLKPFAQKLKDALDRGEAFYRTVKGKHTYVYYIK